jgi:predicted transposase YbfD/YdcC
LNKWTAFEELDMEVAATRGFPRFFSDMPDPRAANKIHKLHDMIVIAVMAVICGADGWAQVAVFGRGRKKWPATFLELPGGIPSHDTFGRVFSLLAPDAFERCFAAWMSPLVERSGGSLIAIDGKSIRRSFEHAWVVNDTRWLGEDLLKPWTGLAGGTLAPVRRTRQDPSDLSGKITTERHCYISSLKGRDDAAAKIMAQYIRGHWAVENNLHWQLDMSFNEDQRRIRKGNGAENFSRLCRIALNLLKKDTSLKAGIKTKRINAGWDHDYLLKLIAA